MQQNTRVQLSTAGVSSVVYTWSVTWETMITRVSDKATRVMYDDFVFLNYDGLIKIIFAPRGGG